jgi:ADP-heptose:LPS heptosyltransferase
MPSIKLKQVKGCYHFGGQSFEAGRIYCVDNKTAFYLTHNAGVAVEVTEQEKKIIEEEKTAEKAKVAEEKKIIKIALVRLGGLGDSLLLAAHAKAIKRKYPNSEISLYIRDACELLNELPAVSRVVACGNVIWWNLVDELRKKNQYDIVFDNRYITKVFFREEKNLKPEFLEDQKSFEKKFKAYESYYNGFIESCADLEKLNLPVFDLFYKSTGLTGGEDDIQVHLNPQDFKFTKLLGNTKYVTVHNGSDIARQTKCYPTYYWNTVVEDLKKRGYEVIQLGKKFEEEIIGAKNMCGVTTLYETAALISKAAFHLDSEGGLVHIAKAVGTRSIVVFGPTPVKCFGYESNINVVSEIKCRGCWWSTSHWWRDCPQGYESPPKCMKDIKPERVIEAIDKIENLPPIEKPRNEMSYNPDDVNEKFAIELQLTEGHYKSQKHQWERICTMMDEVKGPKVLEVGAGDGYCVQVLKKRGFEVTATEISKIRLQRMKDDGIEAIEADVNNLPFPDNSFDTVMCGEVLEHLPSMAKGLAELERVCKPDGKIIISLPITKRYDGIPMHLWSIRQKNILYEGKPDLSVMVFQRINGNV